MKDNNIHPQGKSFSLFWLGRGGMGVGGSKIIFWKPNNKQWHIFAKYFPSITHTESILKNQATISYKQSKYRWFWEMRGIYLSQASCNLQVILYTSLVFDQSKEALHAITIKIIYLKERKIRNEEMGCKSWLMKQWGSYVTIINVA